MATNESPKATQAAPVSSDWLSINSSNTASPSAAKMTFFVDDAGATSQTPASHDQHPEKGDEKVSSLATALTRIAALESDVRQRQEKHDTVFAIVHSHTQALGALCDKSSRQAEAQFQRFEGIVRHISVSLHAKERKLVALEQTISDFTDRISDLGTRVAELQKFQAEIQALNVHEHLHHIDTMGNKIDDMIRRHGHILFDATRLHSEALSQLRSSVSAGALPCCDTVLPCKHSEESSRNY
ncbi:MAG: hypothetical protein Q9157_003191 [Trypethelium eluteriae]